MISKASCVTTTSESEWAQEMKLAHHPWTRSFLILKHQSYKMLHVTWILITNTLNNVLPLLSLSLAFVPNLSSKAYEEKEGLEGPSLNSV